MPPPETERVARHIVDAAIKVHKALGPGLLESAYNACLMFELQHRGFEVRAQVPLPVIYSGHIVDLAYRIDLLVNNTVVVETKAVSKLLPVHEAQVLSYLRLANKPLGLLLNFHVPLMKDGITRLINK